MAKVIWKDVGDWTNNTLYVCGDLANDVPTSTKYYNTILHTSAATGTFADERAAHPEYWRTGLQVIPAEWLDEYRATLTENLPADATRKRYPFRIPLRQKFGYKVSAKQQEQRNRWLEIKTKFKNIPWAVRQRWYAARPPWASLLWYYNYFMMSGLMGNAVVGDKGGGVIKDIGHYVFTLPAGTPANVTVNIDTCDPAKAVAFLFGAGGLEVNPGGTEYYAFPVYPYLVSIASTYAIFKASMDISWATGCSASIIEYI